MVAGMAETEGTRDELSPVEIGLRGEDEGYVRREWEGLLRDKQGDEDGEMKEEEER